MSHASLAFSISNADSGRLSCGMQAAYIRVPRIARRKVHEAGLPFRDGLHAASHAMLNVIPLFMLCGATDMGAECDNPYDTRYRPERLLVYDKHPGGIGLAAQVGNFLQRSIRYSRPNWTLLWLLEVSEASSHF